ncbi:hypothetical protein BD310DRAFT_689351 [Dichomitus squalens]|uniref:Uncharacterized protein n=1 Tax=Dichomitus squalens TaxID=114155 RepID=A0A4Q9PM95_9APHY|nr:hypothetical protein BD310DRAFT_689351 [Dichomitus squalens]
MLWSLVATPDQYAPRYSQRPTSQQRISHRRLTTHSQQPYHSTTFTGGTSRSSRLLRGAESSRRHKTDIRRAILIHDLLPPPTRPKRPARIFARHTRTRQGALTASPDRAAGGEPVDVSAIDRDPRARPLALQHHPPRQQLRTPTPTDPSVRHSAAASQGRRPYPRSLAAPCPPATHSRGAAPCSDGGARP